MIDRTGDRLCVTTEASPELRFSPEVLVPQSGEISQGSRPSGRRMSGHSRDARLHCASDEIVAPDLPERLFEGPAVLTHFEGSVETGFEEIRGT